LDNVVDKLPQEELTEELYFEKPFSWFILMRPLSWWLIGSMFLFFSFNLGGLFIFVISLIFGIFNVVPFILKKDILLTDKELSLKLGFCEDVIEIENIVSIQYIGEKPLLDVISKFTWEVFWNWGLWNLPPFLGVYWTKTDGEETKWYIYGSKRRYLRINRKKGIPICIGVNEPMLFASNLEKLRLDIGYNLVNDLKKIRTMYEQTPTDKLFNGLMGHQEDYRRMLEMKIKKLVKNGLNRDQVIREMAEREDVLGVPDEMRRVVQSKGITLEEIDPRELYESLINYYSDLYGSSIRFDKEIESNIKQGLSRDEAILKIAKKKGFEDDSFEY
jgi:hypothetical protein